MVRAIRQLSIAPLALVVLAIGAPRSFANSINLLQAGGATQAILMTATDPDDNVWTDEECLALKDQPSAEQSILYLLCLDAARETAPISSGMASMAGLPMFGVGRYPAAQPPVKPLGIVTGLPGVTVDSPASLEPAAGAFAGPDHPRVFTVSDLFPAGPAGPFSERIMMASVAGFADADDPLIVLDPRERTGTPDMAAVPEPGTWLLVGTGLAAAWRARRRRN